jgi:deazaflavin-dependent oxidoreductase (nitroreductase family)
MEVRMAGSKDGLKERLARYRQIKISVIGRKSGQTVSIPVWFMLEREKLYLLPVQGSDTHWYKNVLQNPSIRIDARGAEAEFRAMPITEAKAVNSVIEKFREKYGAKDVKKYYSKFDVAVLIELV